MKVTIANIERAPGLPASIAYQKVTPIQVDIDWEQDVPSPLTFTIVDNSNVNGDAEFIGGELLTQSGVIKLRGISQTHPQHSGNMKLKMECNGNQAWLSQAFSVCAHPCAVRNGPDFVSHILEEPCCNFVGMYIQICVESDSGNVTDLDLVDDVEVVSEPRNHSPSMNGQPQKPPTTSGVELVRSFMFDRHNLAWDAVIQYADQLKNIGGNWSNDQLDLFQCPRCGMQARSVVPNSGYRIERSFFTNGDGRVRHRIYKFPHDVTIGNDSTMAGPGIDAEVVVDVEHIVQSAQEYDSDMLKLAGISGSV